MQPQVLKCILIIFCAGIGFGFTFFKFTFLFISFLQGELDNPKVNALYVMKGTLEGMLYFVQCLLDIYIRNVMCGI